MNTKPRWVCLVGLSAGLDNSLRRWVQDPHKILGPFIKKGMSVVDLGCGPGVFSVEMARLLDGSGCVIAADLRAGMLDIVRRKVTGTDLEQRVRLHQCSEESTGITEPVDFVLAFYMIHEVPHQERLFRELISLLKPEGKIFVIEPKIHVTKKSFERMLELAQSLGLHVVAQPKVFFSRAVVLEKRYN